MKNGKNRKDGGRKTRMNTFFLQLHLYQLTKEIVVIEPWSSTISKQRRTWSYRIGSAQEGITLIKSNRYRLTIEVT